MPLFQAESLQVDTDGSGVALLKIDVPGRAVNVLTPHVLADLDAALDRVAEAAVGAKPLRLLVIRGMKKTGFLAGADIGQFADIKSAEEASQLSGRGQKLFDKLERLPIPTLAVVHGPCLGGGLELALACDYRLVVEGPGTQLGLPEVELGLLPGWGGTQRLPRIVGLERALIMILGRKRLGARDAHKWGLADAIARTEGELRGELDKMMQKALASGKRPRRGLPWRGFRQKLLESNPLGRGMIFAATRRLLSKRTPDDMPAPFEAFEAVRTGVKQGMAEGLAFERAAAGRLATSGACRNLVSLFLEREQARKKPEGGEPIRRVGVVGAGTMGAGIAQLAAIRGCEVVVQETDAETLGAGLLRIQELFAKAVERGVLNPEDARKKLSAIKGSVNWDGFENVDLVVEAVVEDVNVKRSVFQTLERRTKPTAILATNTSSLSVGALQEGLQHPGRVAGLHFFNPVHKMELVEVIRTPATEPAATDALVRWSLALGKTPIRVGDGPGFVVNRILMPYANEALLLVSEGLDPAEVDGAMTKFGMLMGPLEMLDTVGLDVAAHVAESMIPAFGARYSPSPAFKKLGESGWKGRKVNAGFYRYRGERKSVNKDALPLIRSEPPPWLPVLKNLPKAARLAQARDRMVLLMVNEAAACLGEGQAETPQALDLAMVLGTGWAPHRGGPLHYCDHLGAVKAVEALKTLATIFGPRFEPSGELLRRAAEGGRFFS